MPGVTTASIRRSGSVMMRMIPPEWPAANTRIIALAHTLTVSASPSRTRPIRMTPNGITSGMGLQLLWVGGQHFRQRVQASNLVRAPAKVAQRVGVLEGVVIYVEREGAGVAGDGEGGQNRRDHAPVRGDALSLFEP